MFNFIKSIFKYNNKYDHKSVVSEFIKDEYKNISDLILEKKKELCKLEQERNLRELAYNHILFPEKEAAYGR